MNHTYRNLVLALSCVGLLPLIAQKQPVPSETTSMANLLPVHGKVTDGQNKMEGCEVVVFRDNEEIESMTTGRAGKFEVLLETGPQYAVEFRKDGFLPKRLLVDTSNDLPAEQAVFMPLAMDLSLLKAEKYEGGNTDVLDFPFAIIRFDKRAGTFVQDQQYTMDMMRANGAVLLMAGRAGKD
jgi:hypothetical protein